MSVLTEIEDFFGKSAAEIKADLARADGYITEHAPALESALNAAVGFMRLVAPQFGAEAGAFVTEGEKALAELQALYVRYFGTPPA